MLSFTYQICTTVCFHTSDIGPAKAGWVKVASVENTAGCEEAVSVEVAEKTASSWSPDTIKFDESSSTKPSSSSSSFVFTSSRGPSSLLSQAVALVAPQFDLTDSQHPAAHLWKNNQQRLSDSKAVCNDT